MSNQINLKKVSKVLWLFHQVLKSFLNHSKTTRFQLPGHSLISQSNHQLSGSQIYKKDMSSSIHGHRKVFHSPSGLEHLPILLVSQHHYYKDSVEKQAVHQLTSLNSILSQYQKSLMRLMNIQKMVHLFQDYTLKVQNGTQRSYALPNPRLWSCIAQCQSFTSNQSRRGQSHHKMYMSAHVITIQSETVQLPETPSCLKLILRQENTQLSSG